MVNIYIDGESHFIRSEACFHNLHSNKPLESAVYSPPALGIMSYPNKNETIPILRVKRECKFFWDRQYAAYLNDLGLRSINRDIRKAVFFSSFSGNEDRLHSIRVFIREEGFEPRIIHERKQLEKRRDNQKKTSQLIYKAKGVDIGLAVRLLEDAYLGVFDECFIFTSDVDFVPAIEIVRRLGRKVYVCGYQEGLGKNSALEYIPDRFIDLEERVKSYILSPQNQEP